MFLTHLLWCCLVHLRVIRLLLPILEKSQPATAICLVQISKTVKTCGEWAEERDTTLRFVIWICILWTLRREVAGMLQICSKYGKPCKPFRYIPAEKLCSPLYPYLEEVPLSELCFHWGLLSSGMLHHVNCDWCLKFQQNVVVSSSRVKISKKNKFQRG